MNELITTVICKKYFRSGGDTIFGEFQEGVEYQKFTLEDYQFSSLEPVPYKYKYIYVYNNNGKGGIRFHLNKNDHRDYLPNFYDYFYDNKELRKIKLQKINSYENF